MNGVSESELAEFGDWLERESGERLTFARGNPERGVRHGPNRVTFEELVRWVKNWAELSNRGGGAKALAVASAVWGKVFIEGEFPKPSPQK